MADRKQTPSILDDLLTGQPEAKDAGKPAEQLTSIPVSQQAGKPVQQHTSKPVRKPAGKPAQQKASRPAEPAPEEEKLKATYYLSQRAMDDLEEAWHKLRKQARPEDRAKVSKSLIVEIAIRMALEDLQAKDKDSRLTRTLVHQ